MKWKVSRSVLNGTISIPPSKSHTIRALLIATLADGQSVIHKPLLKGDGASALQAAKALGADITIDGDSLTINGTGRDFNRGQEFLYLGNSGTGTNLFASVAALGSRMRRFDGDNSLRSRPFKPILEALQKLGATYKFESTTSDLPFTIQGPIRGGETEVNGISSQFLSSILLAAPLVQNGKTICNVYNLHERPYVELTLWWLSKQNISIEYDSSLTKFIIPGNQHYTPFELRVPADFSSATFAAVGGAITGGSLSLTGLDFSDPQGDKGVFTVLSQTGADVKTTGNTSVSSRSRLTGRVIDLNDMPDALPALSVLACMCEGETRFVNVSQARIKETDRIAVMCKELSKMGADIQEQPDGLIIRKSTLKGALVNGHDDHRVVMALALAGMVADGETVIETAEDADVTYPTFVGDFQKIGANIQIV